jgi:hypothetical protein
VFTSPTSGGPVTTFKVFIGPARPFLSGLGGRQVGFFLREVADFEASI